MKLSTLKELTQKSKIPNWIRQDMLAAATHGIKHTTIFSTDSGNASKYALELELLGYQVEFVTASKEIGSRYIITGW